jgi:hypothetical protein
VGHNRYLIEANLLEDLKDMCQVNLVAAKTLKDAKDATDITASALSHLARMYDALGFADKAIELNKEGLELRGAVEACFDCWLRKQPGRCLQHCQ